MVNQEIVMETTHGRKNKCKTEFKAVLNKVLVSGLVLTTLVTSTVTPALAATNYSALDNNGISYTQSYGVSVEQSISEIRNTINAINEMRATGKVSDVMLQTLASQINALGQAVSYSGEINLDEVNSVLNDAEQSVRGIKGNTNVNVAISIVRALISEDGKGSVGGNTVSSESKTVTQYYAAPMVDSFWDVKQGDWYYTQVQAMTQRGLFAGKGTNANGEATFGPNDPMTRAEFVTVVARILYDEDNLKSYGGEWWSVYYTALVDGGVFTTTEFSSDSTYLNSPMPRQEMAMLSIRAMQQRGENFGNFYEPNVRLAIPDIDTVGSAYTEYVLRAYSEGILAGKEGGRFAPTDTLTRAEATTVLYRIVEPSVREKKDFLTPESSTNENNTVMTIYEGQTRCTRPAREGDTFVKADGTQIVLKKGPNGVLGEGQGVAPDVGLTDPKGAWIILESGDYMGWNMGETSIGGDTIDWYYINPLTGEGHWAHEWTVICNKTDPMLQGIKGTTWNEVSEDKNFVWKGTEWQPLAPHPEVYDKLVIK